MKFSSIRRRISWPIEYAIVWVLTKTIALLPLRCLRFLSDVFGRLIFLIPGNRKLILANLHVAFPDWDDHKLKEVGLDSTQGMLRSFFEYSWVLAKPARLPRLVVLPDDEKAMMKKERDAAGGLMAFSPHIGNWELGNYGMNGYGFRTWAVARRQPNPFVQAMIQRGRRASGAGVILEKGAAKEIFRRLRTKECVIMLVDQNTKPHQGGVFVDFFGLPASMSRAPAMFAKRTNVPLVRAVCIRQPDGRYAIEVHKLDIDTGDSTELEICEAINRATEDLIREHPEQYLWLYRRFRYIPSDWDGDHSRYPDYSRVYEMPEEAG